MIKKLIFTFLILLSLEVRSQNSVIEEELLINVGEDFEYMPLLGDREPPLNYRD